MTQSTRTIAEIESAMSICEGFINAAENFLRDLRAAEWKPGHVVGFPQYGFFLHEDQEGLASILHARVFTTRGRALVLGVRNRKGELAQVMRRDDAIDAVISSQEDHVTSLWGMYRDLETELCERLDDAANEAEYYDRFAHWDGSDEAYEEYRDAKAERDADARQDR